jgi:hypothetical protein
MDKYDRYETVNKTINKEVNEFTILTIAMEPTCTSFHPVDIGYAALAAFIIQD